MKSITKAELVLRKCLALSRTAFVEMVIWRVPKPVVGSRHDFKYSLALVADGACVLRYDNEAGKGDHLHAGDRQIPYRFTSLERLQEDFWTDIASWRNRK